MLSFLSISSLASQTSYGRGNSRWKSRASSLRDCLHLPVQYVMGHRPRRVVRSGQGNAPLRSKDGKIEVTPVLCPVPTLLFPAAPEGQNPSSSPPTWTTAMVSCSGYPVNPRTCRSALHSPHQPTNLWGQSLQCGCPHPLELSPPLWTFSNQP